MRNFLALLAFGIFTATLHSQENWKPAGGKLMTRWAKDVSPDRALPEYPRPQMVRKDWMNLNGLWNYTITGKDERFNETTDQLFAGKILVPFPIESALSGVMKPLDENHKLWYQRTFTIPSDWNGKRILLHFGAVDWETAVFVNRKKVGEHRGGYDSFSFDITDALNNRSDPQEILVAVSDPTDASTQPRGKQIRNPHGIWYTPTSGIWQTVWLEPVTAAHISGLKITPDVDGGKLNVEVSTEGLPKGAFLAVTTFDGNDQVNGLTLQTNSFSIPIPNQKLWSPESPFLYDLKVLILKNGNINDPIDEVSSYFAMRKISLGKDEKGFLRILLNNKPYFQLGPLDQGFWPDGLYTAPTDEALRYDIEMTKKLGFNMARKHVKVEPDRWYYWCDKLGLLVWQDMPSGDKYISGSAPDITRTPESAKEFETEWKEIITEHINHPCIVMWVPFNEGWGQWDTPRIVNWTKELDPTRLVDNASGWTDRGVGDVNDMHKYPGPDSPKPETNRAVVLGEFGGLGLPVKGHTWQEEKNWGYRSFSDSESLTRAYIKLMRKLFPLIQSHGLSAAIYTQTTDVEIEVNGLMTYDRELVKPELKKVADANHGVFPPEPKRVPVVPTSQTEPQVWQYSFSKPTNGCEKCEWYDTNFDGRWMRGPGGFGTRDTPRGIINTKWKTKDIWLRRDFILTETNFEELVLSVYHDDDAEIYFNGVLAAKLSRANSNYDEVEIDPRARAALKTGKNLMAVHCHQNKGWQYIDVGLLNLVSQ